MSESKQEPPVYQVVWTERAEKQLRKLDRQIQPRIIEAADSLATQPRPATPKQGHRLKGRYLELWTRYVGIHYRIVYDIDDRERIVTIDEVGPREGIYKPGR